MEQNNKHYNICEENIFSSGHQACPGCGQALAFRYVLNTMGPDTIAVVPPSCAAIISGPQPYSSMRIPVYQTTLESSAVSAAGIKRALIAKGQDHTNVIAIAGDGGTYDIGFQALSSAAERGEDIIYFCMDNEGYMNTGTQKSSSTPRYAYTTSTPGGKPTMKKNLAEIMAAHQVPYVATATIGYPDDLVNKVIKAKEFKGTRLIIILTPCLDGWGMADNSAVRISRLAVSTGIFPLYEVENGVKYTLNHGADGTPVSEYMKVQRRYRHITAEQMEQVQAEVDEQYKILQRKISCFA